MALAGRELSTRREISSGDLIQGMVPVLAPGDPPRASSARPWSAIHLPQRLEAQVRGIAQAFQEYKQLKLLRQPIKGIYILLFLLMTPGHRVLRSPGSGSYLARGITVPIQQLAQGRARSRPATSTTGSSAQARRRGRHPGGVLQPDDPGPQVLEGAARAGLRGPPVQARRARRAAAVHRDGAGGRGDGRGLGGCRRDRDDREPRGQPDARHRADGGGRPALRRRVRRPGVPGPR